MKRRRPPFARRSVWVAIAILAMVTVIGAVVIGYQIHQLQSDIDGLNHQLTLLNQAIQRKGG
jgi:hypothetical protein